MSSVGSNYLNACPQCRDWGKWERHEDHDPRKKALERIQTIHLPDGGFCREDGSSWPCQTVLAIGED